MAMIADTAFVEKGAKVTERAKVMGYARVGGRAKIGGRAKVAGVVWGSSHIAGDAWIPVTATVRGNAQITNRSDLLNICNVSRFSYVTAYRDGVIGLRICWEDGRKGHTEGLSQFEARVLYIKDPAKRAAGLALVAYIRAHFGLA